jgi:SAM-dependent methyltransferase
VPWLLSETPDWHLNRNPEFDALLESARAVGWKEAVRRNPSVGSWFAEEFRGVSLLFTACGPGRVVLDLGCGPGALAFFAAKMGADVYALDPTASFVQFLEERRRQDGVGNLQPIFGSDRTLPFPPAYFDVVLLNGVLEWLPQYYPDDGPPDEVQRRILARVAPLLKPGGCVACGIENRFGIRYLLGARDEHTGARWAQVLPRPFANLLYRWRRGRPLRPRTHSHGGLKRLFGRAGLGHRNTVITLPDYRSARVLFDAALARETPVWVEHLESFAGTSRKRRTAVAAGRLFAKAGVFRALPVEKLSNAFLGIFGDAAAGRRVLDDVLRSVVPDGEGPFRYVARVGHKTAAVFACRNGKPRWVLRIPMMRDACVREADLLGFLKDHPIRRFLVLPAGRGTVGALPVIVYPFVRTAGGREPVSWAEAIDLLSAMWGTPLRKIGPEAMPGISLRRRIDLFAGLSADLDARRNAFLRAWEDRFGQERWCHGDFRRRNMLRRREGLCLIDFDQAHTGSAAGDWLNFWVPRRDLRRPVESAVRVLGSAAFRDATRVLLERLSVGPESAALFLESAVWEYTCIYLFHLLTDRERGPNPAGQVMSVLGAAEACARALA